MKKTPTKKKVTKKKVKKEEAINAVVMDGFAAPVDSEQDYPYVPPTEEADVGARFYTEKYEINSKDKKILAELVSKKAFRTFEKYIDWRVNAAAHRMKNLLILGEKEKATVEAAEINALVKITQDMENFWNEVKGMENEDSVLIRKAQTDLARVFGDDKYILNMGNDEAERI